MEEDLTITEINTTEISEIEEEGCGLNYRERGYIYEKGPNTYLWAGDDSITHFNITQWEFDECNLKFGFGREHIPALMNPQYISLNLVRDRYSDGQKSLVLYTNDSPKIFPYAEMIRYELVNELADGNPIMIAYCILADLGAIYTRVYCDVPFTFALSGYTYYEDDVWDGLDAFVLWDRDTESLWWPLIDEAVSGSMKGTALEKFDENAWEIMTWEEILINFSEARVLLPDQPHQIPEDYPRRHPRNLDCN